MQREENPVAWFVSCGVMSIPCCILAGFFVDDFPTVAMCAACVVGVVIAAILFGAIRFVRLARLGFIESCGMAVMLLIWIATIIFCFVGFGPLVYEQLFAPNPEWDEVQMSWGCRLFITGVLLMTSFLAICIVPIAYFTVGRILDKILGSMK